MVGIRTLAGGFAAWMALSCTAQAAPLSWFDSQATLTAWYANQLNSAGNIYAPPARANTITNLPTNWYAPQTPAPAPVAPAAPAPVPTVAPVATPIPEPASRPVVMASQVDAAIAPAPAALSFNREPAFGSLSSNAADAFINLGGGPYAEASTLAAGDPKPWYQSPAVVSAFGGTPSATQQASFAGDVLAKVERTFALSGLDVKLTDDPNVSTPHEMSVVSNASYGPNPNAIGITSVGDSGFSFIDKLNYADTPDQLSWAVAHNVAHELMHAFGVSDHPDQTGGYLDAAVADWKMLTDPNTTFSPSAVALMKSLSNGTNSGTVGAEILKSGLLAAQCHCNFCDKMTGLGIDGAQVLAAAVPEPTTFAVWAAAGLGALAVRRRSLRVARPADA